MTHIPFSYAAHCKRNINRGLPFFADNLADDFLLIAIAFAPLSSAPLAMVAGLLLLHFSIWSIYEVGYFENDVVAATLEPNGKLPARFIEFRDAFSEPVSWLAASLLAAAGIGILFAAGLMPSALQAAGPAGWMAAGAIWAFVLLGLRQTYRIYNRIDKASRVFLYLPLQLFKYCFAMVFLPLPAAGAALLFAQISRRWVPYIVYRNAGRQATTIKPRVIRLLVFCVLWLLLLPTQPLASHALIGVVALLVLLVRARGEIRGILHDGSSAANDSWRAT